ncbi:hypothetical protein CYMTET_52558 [Cymbomonas tetramitiformis]|uniref:BZIP domain-containing protein n=1 Tax=Cymbomonas tetramitiformis TaxID=36881 RepID=A0AAE0BJ15_9CHLO|nr:hypothetical protein CYMTET_52558 [Cymbomonas tetramitiformis]
MSGRTSTETLPDGGKSPTEASGGFLPEHKAEASGEVQQKLGEQPGAGEASCSYATEPICEAAKSADSTRRSDSDEPTPTSPSGTKGSGGPIPRMRTANLREQNCRAQKRYRERQKMQKKQLEKELGSLRTIATHGAKPELSQEQLEEQQNTYENRLKEQAEVISLLKQQVEVCEMQIKVARMLATQSSSTSHASQLHMAVQELEELQNLWMAQVHKLATIVNSPQASQETLLKVIKEACELFNRIYVNPNSVAFDTCWASSLQVTDMQRCQCFPTQELRTHWIAVAGRLQLSQVHCTQLVSLRSAFLQEMPWRYQERRNLQERLQAVTTKWQIDLHSATDAHAKLSQLQHIGLEGYALLDGLKKNLLAEEQALNTLNNQLLWKVLGPSETMKLLVEAQPHNPDGLMLAHAFADAAVMSSPEKAMAFAQASHLSGIGGMLGAAMSMANKPGHPILGQLLPGPS